MPVFRLPVELCFPPPHLAEPDGLLAVGGDLSPPRLLLAYSQGIFPWFGPGEPLLWWSPEPRCILTPGDLHCSRSLGKRLRQGRYEVSIDRDFAAVVRACAEVHRERAGGTWLGAEMQAAYLQLHRLGYAHAVECWQAGELQGGLYGVALGRCFFGESMFHRQRDASKVAFAVLVRTLFAAGFTLFDCQLPTPHLQSLGARTVSRAVFLAALRRGGVTPGSAPPVPFFPSRPLT